MEFNKRTQYIYIYILATAAADQKRMNQRD